MSDGYEYALLGCLRIIIITVTSAVLGGLAWFVWRVTKIGTGLWPL